MRSPHCYTAILLLLCVHTGLCFSHTVAQTDKAEKLGQSVGRARKSRERGLFDPKTSYTEVDSVRMEWSGVWVEERAEPAASSTTG